MAYATTGGLLFVDLNFLAVFALSGILRSATQIELLVFSLQVVKIFFVIGVKRLRESGPALIVDLFGAELLLLPLLVAMDLFAGLGELSSVLSQLLTGWMVGVACVGLPYAAFKIGRSMMRSASLASVLPTSVVVSELSVLFANASFAAAASQTGVAGVAEVAFLGRGSAFSGSPLNFLALIAVYISLLLYAVVGMDAKVVIDGPKALVLAVLATSASVALAVLFSLFSLPLALAYIPPTVAIVSASWWLTRAH